MLISISGAFILMTATLYITYGWTLKTHAAVTGTLISLIVTGLLANFFVTLTRLTGFGSEDALFLIQQSQSTINMRGLVLGGMLIGALGVLDDLVITQASAVFELYYADPEQGRKKVISQCHADWTGSCRSYSKHPCPGVRWRCPAYSFTFYYIGRAICLSDQFRIRNRGDCSHSGWFAGSDCCSSNYNAACRPACNPAQPPGQVVTYP